MVNPTGLPGKYTVTYRQADGEPAHCTDMGDATVTPVAQSDVPHHGTPESLTELQALALAHDSSRPPKVSPSHTSK